MRAVFVGHTGLGKESIARQVALEAARIRGLAADLRDPRTRRFIQVFSIEDEIKNALGDLRPFLDQIVKRERLRHWKEAMEDILNRTAGVEHTILCFHNVFHRDNNFFTCVDWDLLSAYRPTVFVTLINDVYDSWETISARERDFPSNSYIHLPEILAWRSAEISATECLAENIYVKPERYSVTPDELKEIQKDYPHVSRIFGRSIPHFVFAIKHPLRTLYQLLFRRDLLPIYASFPITKPREEEEKEDYTGHQEIDSYRQRLFSTDFLTVFDPLTIDELRLHDPWVPRQQALKPRWPVKIGPPMVNDVPLTTDPFSGYSEAQFASFRSSVGRHVESRDYQLVSQAVALAAYRPYYGGHLGSGARPSNAPSSGVDKELGFASTESKVIFAVHPAQDRSAGVKIFSNINFAVAPQTIDELLLLLKGVYERRAERMMERSEPQTWE